MSVAIEPGCVMEADETEFVVPLHRLTPGRELRTSGLDPDHVRVLSETVEEWPPILVWGDGFVIVDGAHRAEAARRLGRAGIRAVRFHGTEDDVLVEFLRRNVHHGLPLTLEDRRQAARRVLAGHAEWSDRWIASLCGLSGKTVAKLRREEVKETGDRLTWTARRVGRDGKARPVQPEELRNRIRRAIEANPTASLRTIGAVAGASPETVRTVKGDLDGGGSRRTVPAHRRQTAASPSTAAPIPVLVPLEGSSTRQPWASDRALLASAEGEEFVRWFAGNSVGEDWYRYVGTVPLGRVYDVVDEARRRAKAWTDFASLLEARTR